MRISNWQRTEGATKRPPRNMPDPFPRPGDEESKRAPKAQQGDVVSVGGIAAKVTTVADFTAKREQREQRWREKHESKGGDVA